MYESPLGPLTLAGVRSGLENLFFPGQAPRLTESAHRPDLLDDAVRQLGEYFAGERQRFELELGIVGSAFQRSVWRELFRIPYGTTASYSEIAGRIGRPGEAREVGWAIGRTPVPIVMPCHRVVAADGALTGYGGGLQRKQALLDLECRVAAGLSPEPAWAFRQLQIL